MSKIRVATKLLFVLFVVCISKLPAQDTNTIRIMSYNMQIFGVSKMNKPDVVATLLDIVDDADVIAIQEVRSASPAPVEEFMARLPLHYDYVLGPREGRSSSKEQFWLIYDTRKIALLGTENYADPDDAFERSPFAVHLRCIGGENAEGTMPFDFIIVNNHLKPGDVHAEIALLPAIGGSLTETWQEADVIYLGDFNSDGNYYDEAHLGNIFPQAAYTSIIGNEADTTTASSSNTYDRIIMSNSAKEDWTGNWGVEIIAQPGVSDHYPVWAEFYTDRDRD
jgi:endonuclease/exonuclease/phosphatase family metal-dependent hydrolase